MKILKSIQRTYSLGNLKYYRKQKGFRQIDLALEINKGYNYINSIENEKYFPSPETIEQIAAVLEVEPMELFNREEPQSSATEENLKIKLDSIENQLKKEIVSKIEAIFKSS